MHTVSQARDLEVESLWHRQYCFQRSKPELVGWVSGQVKAFRLIKAPDASALGWLEVTGGVGGADIGRLAAFPLTPESVERFMRFRTVGLSAWRTSKNVGRWD